MEPVSFFEELSPLRKVAAGRGDCWSNHPMWAPPIPLYFRTKYLAARLGRTKLPQFRLLVGFHDRAYLATQLASKLGCPMVSYFFTTYSQEVLPSWAPTSGVRRLSFRVNALFAHRVDMLTRESVVRSDATIVSGESSYESIKKLHPGAKLFIIPPGVDVQKFNPSLSRQAARSKLGLPLNRRIILFVGQLIKRKGLAVLIRAFRRIHRGFPSSLLVLVGDGPERTPCLNIARRLGVLDAVIFAGAHGSDTLSSFYRAADVFVLPSFQEGFGIVLLEAMA